MDRQRTTTDKRSSFLLHSALVESDRCGEFLVHMLAPLLEIEVTLCLNSLINKTTKLLGKHSTLVAHFMHQDMKTIGLNPDGNYISPLSSCFLESAYEA